jgi:hypothetical protein
MEESEELPCVEKLAFDSKKQAQTAATVADYQHDTKVAPYMCQYCGLWHLKSVY